MTVVDVHVHLAEFTREKIEEFVSRGYILVGVAEDYETSLKVLELRDSYPENVKACVGIHPWSLRNLENYTRELELVSQLLPDADCVGEVGLDKKFVPETFHQQLEVFRELAGRAVERGVPLNVHSAGAWREVLDVLGELGAKKVVLHWWTGPLNLLLELSRRGYFVSVNAALKVQEKSRVIAREVSLDALLTESDGPYEYRGLSLSPSLIPEALQIIAQIKGLAVDELERAIYRNFTRIFTA